MKLSATVLAKLCVAGAVVTGAGCESAYVMNRDTTPEPILVIEEEPEPEVVEPRFAQPPSGVAPVRPAPAPPKHASTNECGPCGMG
ncbi:MAG TPA: hypothetical protein VIU61_13860 [Kofleriaceae bacterium]